MRLPLVGFTIGWALSTLALWLHGMANTGTLLVGVCIGIAWAFHLLSGRPA